MQKRTTITELTACKGQTPIVCLTAYTAPFARIVDQYVDVLLVGDSLGMVLYGMESTLSVTVQMMVQHGKAVVHASEKACVVVDMPFGSYQPSQEVAFINAAKIMAETGCQAVKLEGGLAMQETIAHLVQGGIPVMGHVGLMPQHVHAMGGYQCQGREAEAAARIIKDAKAVEAAGAFALVLEGVTESLAREITAMLSVPTIGIGASPACDGQVLVTEDMVGLSGDKLPKFVKSYARLGEALAEAAERYAAEVKARQFPDKEAHCYPGKPTIKKMKS